jgi:sigma-B regulation protein RsbU (phosphoserine phosphatase)
MKKIILFKNRSLGFRLAFYICSIVEVLCFFVFLYSYFYSRQIIGNRIETSANLQVRNFVGTIDGLVRRVEKVPNTLSMILSSEDFKDDRLITMLDTVLEKNHEIYGIAIAYEPYAYDKKEYYHSPYVYREKTGLKTIYLGNENYTYPVSDWYQIPIKLDKGYWSEPYIDEGGGGILMATYSIPFYHVVDGKRVARGTVTADISLEGLVKFINNTYISKTGYCFVISRTGTIVCHPNKSLIMHESLFSLADERNYKEMRIMGQDMINGMQGKATFSYKNVQTGKLSWIYYAPIKTSGWSVGVLYPIDELFSDIDRLSKFIVSVIVFSGILLLIIIILVSQSTTKPLTSLASATKLIAEGNFNVNIEPLDRKDEVGELNNSFISMQTSLQYHIENLKKTTADMEKIESEMRIAHDIQMSIIPKLFPPFPDRNEIDLYANLTPVKAVGGDLYDYFFADDRHLVFAIGDVSGKGVPASLLMAMTRTLLRAKYTRSMKPNEIVRIVNEDLCKDNLQKMFVTFFIGILDVYSGEFEYCNAGHNPPYLLRNGGIQQLEVFHGYPIGIQSSPYRSASLMLEPGDTLSMYTDGITDAENKNSELFEESHLEQVLLKNESLNAEGLTKAIISAVESFAEGMEQFDDMTLLTLRYLGGNGILGGKDELFKYTILVKKDIQEIGKLSKELDSLFLTWKISQEVIDDFLLAIDELISNIIFYAFNDENEHIITLRVNYNGKVINAQLEDNGIEFDPLDSEDPVIPTGIHGIKPGGMGIFICKKILHDITYQRIDGKNILTFKKPNI